jgi:AcrR family transcriptional regulator
MSTERKLQERSVRTRAALLDAALDALVDVGYAGTTTTEVVRRAGVSRGAYLHHFSNRSELLIGAVELLLQRRVADFRLAMTDVEGQADRAEAAIDLLWTMYQGRAFTAWLELWVAARTDEGLRRAVVDMERRFGAESRAAFAELFPPTGDDDVEFQWLGRDLAFALMDGLALVALIPHGQRPASDHLDLLKLLARMSLGGGGLRRETHDHVA